MCRSYMSVSVCFKEFHEAELKIVFCWKAVTMSDGTMGEKICQRAKFSSS